MCQSWAGPLDAEESRPPTPTQRPVALQQALLAHHPLRALAVDLAAELAARERRDHARAVGRVLPRHLDDRPVDRVDRGPSRSGRTAPRRSIEPRAVDLHHARHDRRAPALGDQLAGPRDALGHSKPRNASPAISSS
jgi:hypothetical protein